MDKEELTKKLIKKLIKDKTKVKILKEISLGNDKITRISEQLQISMPLLSYHINTDRLGLLELDLIKKIPNKKMTDFKLKITSLGRFVLNILEED